MGIRVLLVDDHALLRAGIREILTADGDFLIVGEAADGRTAAALAGEVAPDVIVIDHRLPDMSGSEALSHIRRHAPAARAVITSAYADEHTASSALAAGAAAFVPKDHVIEELPDAVRAAAAGGTYDSPGLRRILRGR